MFLLAYPLRGQIDFSKYFDESSIPLVDADDHVDPAFVWDMPGNIQVFLNEGINYLKEGDLLLALSNFDEALKLDSQLWVAHYYRGICHKTLRDFKEAEKDLLACIAINPKQAAAHVELGEIHHLQNSFDRAVDEYNKAVAIDPQMTQAYYNLGSVSLARGDVKKGLRYYEKCNEVDPNFPQAFMMQGLLKFKARKKDNESIMLFDKAIAADSTYAHSYFWRGLAWISLDRPDKGLANWTKLSTLAPHNSFYTFMRGFLLIEMGDFDNAFTELRKAMKSIAVDDEKFIGGQTVLDKKIDLQFAANYLITNGYGLNEISFDLLKKAYCLLLAGNPKSALEEIRKAEKVEPSGTVFFLEALAHEHAGDHRSAFHYYTKAIEKDIDNFDARKKRTVYRMELKDWKGADEDLNHMFRLQPKSPVAYRIRGLARSHQNNCQGAIDDLNNFMKTDSSDYEAIRTRSLCLSLVGDKEGSNEDLRRLLDFPGGSDLYGEVAANYLSLNDTVRAIEIWHRYSDRRPYSSIPHMALAKIYITQKNWDSLRVEIERLLLLINNNYHAKEYSEVVFWDGLIDFQQSSYEAAITKFSKSLKSDANNLSAKYFRAKAYEKIGEMKKALAEFKELKKSGYSDSASLYEAVAMQLQ
jgi:tetratricopeptide (TPR) repeat protein